MVAKTALADQIAVSHAVSAPVSGTELNNDITCNRRRLFLQFRYCYGAWRPNKYTPCATDPEASRSAAFEPSPKTI